MPKHHPAAHTGAACPACRQTMEVHVLAANAHVRGDDSVTLDICFACQGMWIEPGENLKLAPTAVVELFRLLHEHRDAPRLPLPNTLDCPHCRSGLTQGFDVVRSGRYITYRCAQGHGRFSPFASFMIEKGFVRQLSRTELHDIARTLGVIHCSGCGAPVDLRKDHACPHCRSAFSLLDPHAVEKALHGYARAATQATHAQPLALADALISMERERERARREQASGLDGSNTRMEHGVDLLAVGVSLVWSLLN